MEQKSPAAPSPTLLFLLLVSACHLSTLLPIAHSIGVNYGTIADNLPPPSQVATFLKTKTTIDRVKIFDTNPDILRAFANTNIAVTVTVGNGDIPPLAKLPAAQAWVAAHILPFHPRTVINRIAVGNEILATSDKNLIAHLLPAMKSLHLALKLANISTIQVATPNSLGILAPNTGPPSLGRFRTGYDQVVFAPMLDFHRETKTPFLINPYPFFGFVPETLNYATFKPNGGVFDSATGMNYTNMFDAQMDAVYSAMKKIGYEDVDLAVGETGWPSAGDPGQPGTSVDNAASYNGNLVRHMTSGKGTPLMPNRTFETYIFALFNENLKPTASEQNYGLFKPDLNPVYDVGILRSQQAAGPTSGVAAGPTSGVAAGPTSGVAAGPKSGVAAGPKSGVAAGPRSGGAAGPKSGVAAGPRSGGAAGPTSGGAKAPSPLSAEKRWCVPRAGSSDTVLQENIDYVCSRGVDCKAIQEGGPCFQPNTVKSHAAYVMNAYYQANGPQDYNCDFKHTGVVTTKDPSYNACTYPYKAEKVEKTVAGGSMKMKSGNRVAEIFMILVASVIFL